jgi:hypothetical protein
MLGHARRTKPPGHVRLHAPVLDPERIPGRADVVLEEAASGCVLRRNKKLARETCLMDHQRIRLDSSSTEAIRERVLRDELEAKARANAAAERAMPMQAVSEWIESLQSANARPASRGK